MSNICIFGDSITWGACDHEKGGWVERLKNHFAKKTDYDISVYNLGIQGENSSMLLKRFADEAKLRKPNIIVIAIGTNDYSSKKDKRSVAISLKDFEKNIININKNAKKFTKNIVFIGLTKIIEKKTTPLPYNKNKYHYFENAKTYNSLLEKICRKEKIKFIPMFDLLKDGDIHQDGLHPNSRGHKKIYNQIKMLLKKEVNDIK